MKDDVGKFEKQLEEFLEVMAEFPNAPAKQGSNPATHPATSASSAEKALSSVQESAAEVRICVKYLLFDLDATRREMSYYKKLLKDKEL